MPKRRINITTPPPVPVDTSISNDYDIDPAPVSYTVPTRSTRAKSLLKAVDFLGSQSKHEPK